MTFADYNSRSIRKLTTSAAIREARGGSAPIMPDGVGAVFGGLAEWLNAPHR